MLTHASGRYRKTLHVSHRDGEKASGRRKRFAVCGSIALKSVSTMDVPLDERYLVLHQKARFPTCCSRPQTLKGSDEHQDQRAANSPRFRLLPFSRACRRTTMVDGVLKKVTRYSGGSSSRGEQDFRLVRVLRKGSDNEKPTEYSHRATRERPQERATIISFDKRFRSDFSIATRHRRGVSASV